ncbi:zymogen granule membrane protein 16-like [Huso huso]|uniref:Zymogen granule membrane protein 16-like n=1 Tax=Huso huso TaxID=61971 RepID=A0ABR0Y9I3_HUSHU
MFLFFRIQVQHGYYWNTVCGTGSGTVHEFQLHSDEKIIQASGKYYDYVYQITFVTNKGRTFTVGQPIGSSFNFYPVYGQSELRYFTGRYNPVGLTSIGFHWGVPFSASRVGLEEDSQLSSGLISSNQTHV